MRSIGRAAAALLWTLLAGGCGMAPPVEPTIRASAETLPWADFSTWHTYRWWLPPIVDEGRKYSEREKRLDWYVRGAVDTELAARGYAPDTAGRPDFVVRYAVQLVEDSTASFGEYLAYRSEGGGKGMGEAFMGIERGALSIELVDVASRRVAWRGLASAVIETDARGRRVGPAVQKMMAQFPGRAR